VFDSSKKINSNHNHSHSTFPEHDKGCLSGNESFNEIGYNFSQDKTSFQY
jgi:hypothetical protein